MVTFPPCQESIVPHLALFPPIGRYPTQCSCPDVNFVVVVDILVIFVIVVLAVFVFVIIENTPLTLCQECIGPQGWLLNQKNKNAIIILIFVVVNFGFLIVTLDAGFVGKIVLAGRYVCHKSMNTVNGEKMVLDSIWKLLDGSWKSV